MVVWVGPPWWDGAASCGLPWVRGTLGEPRHHPRGVSPDSEVHSHPVDSREQGTTTVAMTTSAPVREASGMGTVLSWFPPRPLHVPLALHAC